MPWLDATTRLNLQHAETQSDFFTRPLRSSGFSQIFERRRNTPVISSTTPTAEMMPSSSTSRTRTPPSPSCSELTPPPYCSAPSCSDSSPTDTARDGDDLMASLQPDMVFAEEVLPGEMSTAIEFEKHTEQARKSSRQDIETATAEDSGVENLQHNAPVPEEQIEPPERDPNVRDPREDVTEPKPSSLDQSVPQERRPEAQITGEDMSEPKPEVTPPRTQAAWVTEAVAACQANKKNPLNKGTVLIILDPKDSSKSCLLDAETLCRTSDVLQKLYEEAQVKSTGFFSQQKVTGMLVVSSTSTPELISKALDATIESVVPQPNDTGRLRLTRNTRNAKVKAESDQGDGLDDPEEIKVNWPMAHESFFRMIAGKKHGISKSDLSTALPQIQGVIRIAELCDAVHVVQNAFSSLLVGYVEHHTLFSTIGKYPAQCLNVGIALKSRLVYDEAFKHLVGQSANFKRGKSYDGLSGSVQAIIQRRAQELYHARMEIMMDLLSMTLAVNDRTMPAPDYPINVVSQHQEEESYLIVNIVRDWMSEHIGHLRSELQRPPNYSHLCAHETDSSSVAGFFRTVMAGGETYLPTEKVLEDWKASSIGLMNPREDNDEVMTEALASLKAMASDFVEDLVGSELQLRDTSKLQYLTCVKVGSEDVPWDTESDEDGSEEMDESD